MYQALLQFAAEHSIDPKIALEKGLFTLDPKLYDVIIKLALAAKDSQILEFIIAM